MLWEKYYKKVDFSFSLLKISTKLEKISFYSHITIFLFIFLFVFIHNLSLDFLFNTILLILVTFLYSFFSFKIQFFTPYSDYFLNKKIYNLSLNQKKIFNTHRDFKHPFLFFFTAKKHNCNESVIKKIVFIEGQKRTLTKLKTKSSDLFYFSSIIKIFLLTFFSFWSLLYFIDSLNNIKYTNLVFLLSGIYILITLIIAYTSVSENYIEIYSSQLKNNIYKKYNCKEVKFLISSTPYINNKDKSENIEKPIFSIDIIGIVFGVLFTLYITLIYNKLYPTTTEIKMIINKDITEQLKKDIFQLKLDEIKKGIK